MHPLWSCWCSRWDFLYAAWGVIAGGVLSALEGTLMLPLYLRRIGMDIGKRVVLGEGFAQVVDPDMLHFGDGATVSAMFQAHTFEDRVLKIDHVYVGAHSTLAHGTVPLYGAEIGEHTHIAPHSVIMKREQPAPAVALRGRPDEGAESPVAADEPGAADPALAAERPATRSRAADPGVLAGRPDLRRARRAAGPAKFARYGAVRSNRWRVTEPPSAWVAWLKTANRYPMKNCQALFRVNGEPSGVKFTPSVL